MKIRKNTMALLSVLVLLLPIVTYGNEMVIMGAYDNPPKAYLKNSEAKGFLVDITKWCMNEINYPYTIELYPWKRAYYNALKGKGGIIGLSKNSERLKIFDYSEPLFYGDLMLVVKKGKEFPFKTIDDLKGKVIGIGLGASYGDEFEKAVADGFFKISETVHKTSSLVMLKRERVDAVLIGPGKYGLWEVINESSKSFHLKIEDFSILPVPFKRDSKYLGVHKSLGMKGFLKEFNAAIEKGRNSGEIDKIIERYYK